MQVNDSQGKTEAIFHDGPDSRLAAQAQAAAFAQPNNHLVLRARGPTFKPLAVAIVTRYKHLGTLNEGHARYEVKMAVRAAQSLQAEKPLKKKVFANRAIPHKKRGKLLGPHFPAPNSSSMLRLGERCPPPFGEPYIANTMQG